MAIPVDLTIRDVVPADLDTLVELFVTCFNAPPWNDGWSPLAARQRLEPILAATHFRGLIALVDSSALGLALGQKERWTHSFHFNLQEMCVAPDQQRSGIGCALLEQLLERLRTDKVTNIYLITAPVDGAATFYSKSGFHTSRGRVMMALDLAGVSDQSR